MQLGLNELHSALLVPLGIPVEFCKVLKMKLLYLFIPMGIFRAYQDV